ncbi:hypothetical protein ACWGHM_27015 [Streptomyces sp. NPDC054904]|uniref:hypothetical protein n=1 Tax=unclassified Streptomyces TaxID=2593676 RepID=UPI002481FF10|nr:MULTISPECIES: hypothetical protein [unclassified Streptomyces]MDA5279360.1 hypothetical protein [Streptomyces sp. Isolate_45]MDX2395645.1 hypothetical protein [Streptomyces sp. DK15]
MTVYVVTVPGTLLTELTPDARAELLRALRPADPRTTDIGVEDDLHLLSLYPESPGFALHLEVEAADTKSAERKARDLATEALGRAGLGGEGARLGDPVITGIATE